MNAPLAQRFQEFYERLPVERERALEQFGDIFAADVHFRDTFRDTHGIEPLRELFVRMFKQYRQVEFTDFSRDGDDNRFVLTYDMHLRMAVGPVFVTRMASVVRGRDGLVSELIDYYDFPSTLASPIPLLGTIYRKAISLLFL